MLDSIYIVLLVVSINNVICFLLCSLLESPIIGLILELIIYLFVA